MEENKKKKWLAQYLRLKKREDNKIMTEAVKRLVDKECIIYLFNGQVVGVVKEIIDNSIVVEKNEVQQIINLNFVIRICEYPKNKKNKKKSNVSD